MKTAAKLCRTTSRCVDLLFFVQQLKTIVDFLQQFITLAALNLQQVNQEMSQKTGTESRALTKYAPLLTCRTNTSLLFSSELEAGLDFLTLVDSGAGALSKKETNE